MQRITRQNLRRHCLRALRAPQPSAWQIAFNSALLAIPALFAAAPVQAAVQFMVTDLGTLDGTLQLVSWSGFSGQSSQHFDLFDWGTSSGAFSAIDLSGATLAKGLSWNTSQFRSTGEISITGTALPVPEPDTWALMLAGFPVLADATRRRGVRRGSVGTRPSRQAFAD